MSVGLPFQGHAPHRILRRLRSPTTSQRAGAGLLQFRLLPWHRAQPALRAHVRDVKKKREKRKRETVFPGREHQSTPSSAAGLDLETWRGGGALRTAYGGGQGEHKTVRRARRRAPSAALWHTTACRAGSARCHASQNCPCRHSAAAVGKNKRSSEARRRFGRPRRAARRKCCLQVRGRSRRRVRRAARARAGRVCC